MKRQALLLGGITPLLSFLIFTAGRPAPAFEFERIPVPEGVTVQDGSLSPDGTTIAFEDPFFPQTPGMTLIGLLSVPQGELVGGLETDLNPLILSWDGTDVLLSTGGRLVLVNFDQAAFDEVFDVSDGLPVGTPVSATVGNRGVTSSQVPFVPRGVEPGIWVASAFGAPTQLVQAFDPSPIPGLSLAQFAGLSASGGEFAFVAGSSDVQDPDQVIYAMPVGGGMIRALVERFEDIPLAGGGVATFGRLFNPVLSGGNIVFEGRGAPGDGLYALINGQLHLVATADTAVPGGAGAFQDFGDWSIDGSRVVFAGRDASATWGVYQYTPGSLTKVLAPGDVLDGLLVESAGIPRESLGGGRTLLFTSLGLLGGASAALAPQGVALEPGNYLYVVPEPGARLYQAAALALLLMAATRRAYLRKASCQTADGPSIWIESRKAPLS